MERGPGEKRGRTVKTAKDQLVWSEDILSRTKENLPNGENETNRTLEGLFKLLEICREDLVNGREEYRWNTAKNVASTLTLMVDKLPPYTKRENPCLTWDEKTYTLKQALVQALQSLVAIVDMKGDKESAAARHRLALAIGCIYSDVRTADLYGSVSKFDSDQRVACEILVKLNSLYTLVEENGMGATQVDINNLKLGLCACVEKMVVSIPQDSLVLSPDCSFTNSLCAFFKRAFVSQVIFGGSVEQVRCAALNMLELGVKKMSSIDKFPWFCHQILRNLLEYNEFMLIFLRPDRQRTFESMLFEFRQNRGNSNVFLLESGSLQIAQNAQVFSKAKIATVYRVKAESTEWQRIRQGFGKVPVRVWALLALYSPPGRCVADDAKATIVPSLDDFLTSFLF